MKKAMLNITLVFSFFIIFTACSKQVEDPYFERAKSASEKAQDQLQRD